MWEEKSLQHLSCRNVEPVPVGTCGISTGLVWYVIPSDRVAGGLVIELRAACPVGMSYALQHTSKISDSSRICTEV